MPISRLIKHYLEQAGFLVRTFPRADKVTKQLTYARLPEEVSKRVQSAIAQVK